MEYKDGRHEPISLVTDGTADQPVHVSEFSCRGNETHLLECPYTTIFHCDHFLDTGVGLAGLGAGPAHAPPKGPGSFVSTYKIFET